MIGPHYIQATVPGRRFVRVARFYADKSTMFVGEPEANANLISAAPDLLAALRDLVDEDTTPKPNCACHLCPPCLDCEKHAGRREFLANARAAIAKAEGRTP